MDTAYVNIRAATLSEMIASNATFENKLISERRALMMQDVRIALEGMCLFLSMVDSQLEKGRPLSRAKEKVWRDAEALKEMLLAITRRRTTPASPRTPLVESAPWKTYMNGKPVGSFRASSTEVRAKRYVTMKTRARIPLTT